jgi:hypothetical protein
MDRRQLESLGADYPHLRGLFAIPFGVMMIAAGLGNLEWGPFRSIWAFLSAVAVGGLICLPIARHYNRRYGRVTLPQKVQVRGVLTAAACIPLIVGGAMVDNNLDLPIWGFLGAWALLMLISYRFSVGLRLHHMVLWGALLVGSLLPLWGGLDADLRSNAGLMVAGVAVMVSGIFDHLLLVKAFGNLETSAVANSSVEA